MKRWLLFPHAIRYARQDAETILAAFARDCRRWQFTGLNHEMRLLEMQISYRCCTLALFSLLVVAVSFLQADKPTEETGFVSLFDGKTLAGWEGKKEIFSVREGAIVAGSLGNSIANNEFLCTTKSYGDFELRLQAKLVGPGNNAGIQFRSRRIPNHHEVIGYQCDMGAWKAGVIWGALYDESRRRKMLAEGKQDETAKVLNENDWNDLVIHCQGNRIQIWLNGYRTVDYREKEAKIATKGIIGLQIHGGKPSVASYRNIRIKPL